ncbi:hypothetical protein [Nonomuraea sp. KM88]|uniref:hypothetical protein n=1 Tax=Nonomuraea sp. KM88 TaxID=3457427 RepID=UPI003FCC8AA8
MAVKRWPGVVLGALALMVLSRSAPTPGFALPFDGYLLTPSDAVAIQAARDSCAEAAQDAEAAGRRSTPAHGVRLERNMRRYGITDVGDAERHGYHVPGPLVRPSSTPAADHACAHEAEERLWGGVPEADFAWLSALNAQSVVRSESDPAVVTVTRAWSRCMRTHGFTYPDPLAALQDPAWRLDSAASSPRERAAAVSDVRCKRTTGYVTVRSAAETRFQKELVDRFPAKLTALKQARDRLLRNAEQLTARRSEKVRT